MQELRESLQTVVIPKVLSYIIFVKKLMMIFSFTLFERFGKALLYSLMLTFKNKTKSI